MEKQKRTPDAEATKAQILEAAEKLFVENGFAATSVNQIAIAAGVTKSLIHHHFSTKQKLWSEVKMRFLGQHAEAQKSILSQGDFSQDMMKQSLVAYFHYLQSKPEFVRLMAMSSLEIDHETSDDCCDALADHAIIDFIVSRIAAAQDGGLLRKDLSPNMLFHIATGAVQHWFQSKSFHVAHSGLKDGDEADRVFIENLVEILSTGIRPQNS